MRYQWRYINRNRLVVKDKKHVLTDPGITHILSNHTLKPLRTPPVAIGLHLSIKIQPSNTALEKHPGIIMSDMIYLRNLHLNAVIGPDRWHRSGRSQPVILSIQLKYDLLKAAAKDDVAKTLNYGTLCQEVIEFFIDNTGTWVLHEFAFQVCRLLMDWMFKVTRAEQERRVRVEILLPKGALRVEGGLGVELLMTGTNVDSQFLTVKELKVPCIIGVNSHERVEKQTVVIDLKMNDVSEEDLEWNGQPIVKAVTEHVEGSAYETLEALATFIARILCMDFKVGLVTVSVEKPSALPSVDGAGVEITRDREFFQRIDLWQVDSR